MKYTLRPLSFLFFLSSFLCLLTLHGPVPATAGEGGGRPAPLVGVVPLVRQTVTLKQDFVGYVEGERFVEVRAQVSGVLMAQHYTEGAFVRAGELLFEIDPAQYQAAYDQAAGRLESVRARYTNAKKDLDRAVPLAQRNSISPRELDLAQSDFNSARAELSGAEAALRSAKIQLELSQVKAPISGYATMAAMLEGSLVNAASPKDSLLTTINSTEAVYVTFFVPDALVRRIRSYINNNGAQLKKEAPAELEMDQGVVYPHKGKVVYGNAVVNRETGSMISKAFFPNPEHSLLSGQIVRISVELLSFPDALVIPHHAVLHGQGGPVAVVVKSDDTVEFCPVQVVSGVLPNSFLVASGLKDGERIVVEGLNKVAPGAKVQISVLEERSPTNLETDKK